jgi:RHS repeat-associated protein
MMAVVTDTKVAVSMDNASVSYYLVHVISATDYYAFGSPVPGRSFAIGSYRFGFQGMEKDNEVSGFGNVINFGARPYDSRIGRWLSTDPVETKYPSLSTYHFSNNNPIRYVDYDGRDWGMKIINDGKTKKIVITANYLTTESGAAIAERMVGFWNSQSGKYSYRVGTKESGYEYYEIHFQLTSESVGKDPKETYGHYMEMSSGEEMGNFINIVPLEAEKNVFKSQNTLHHASQNVIELRISSLNNDNNPNKLLEAFHELGHTLFFLSKGNDDNWSHVPNTIMNRSSSPNPTDEINIRNVVNEIILERILETGGLAGGDEPRKGVIILDQKNYSDLKSKGPGKVVPTPKPDTKREKNIKEKPSNYDGRDKEDYR